MILKDLIIRSRQNQCWNESGIDSLTHCFDPDHFQNYPHTVQYQYNSRGFRDSEWPSDLKSAVWCLGDSFTVGLGAPIQHTWPSVLSQQAGVRTVNVSLDGASNQWIARRAQDIISAVCPANMVIMWSYLHRRELQDLTELKNKIWRDFYDATARDFAEYNQWPPGIELADIEKLPRSLLEDLARSQREYQYEGQLVTVTVDPVQVDIQVRDEQRRLSHTRDSIEQDIQDFVDCTSQVADLAQQHQVNVINFIVPDPVPPNTVDLAQLTPNIIPVVVQDRARDGHHFDILTSQHIVKTAQALLK